MPEEKPTPREFLPKPEVAGSRKTSSNKKQERNQDKTMLHLLRLGIITAIIIVSGLIFVAWGTYSEEWQNSFVDSIYRVVPYPAASVGYGNWITLSDYNENVKAMRQFLESKEAALGGGKFDFSTEDGLKRLAIVKKNVLNQLIDNEIVEIIAKQQDIVINEAELDDTANKIISRDGKQAENLTQLDSLYGWGTADFKEKVVKILLYKQKLEDKIRFNGELDKEAKVRLASVKEKLASGTDFAEVAKQYSDSPSKQYGGLLPAFSHDDAPDFFADQAFNLKPGEITQPIEAEDGWHFVKLEKKFNEGGKDKVEVRHILVKKETLKEWLDGKKGAFKVIVFLKPYYWHSQMGKLYFKDDSLNKMEQEMDRIYLNEQNQEVDFMMNTDKKQAQ